MCYSTGQKPTEKLPCDNWNNLNELRRERFCERLIMKQTQSKSQPLIFEKWKKLTCLTILVLS